MEKNISTVILDFGNVLLDLDIPGFYRNVQDLTGFGTGEDFDLLEERLRTYISIPK